MSPQEQQIDLDKLNLEQLQHIADQVKVQYKMILNTIKRKNAELSFDELSEPVPISRAARAGPKYI